MKISLGADERMPVVDHIENKLRELGHELTWYGPEAGKTDPWPQVAKAVAQDVADGRADEGVLLCWTGTGVSMAANKVPGVRAALCADAETARGARLWNNANVLCLSMRTTTPALADEIIERWFATQYEANPTDDACLAQIRELDAARREN